MDDWDFLDGHLTKSMDNAKDNKGGNRTHIKSSLIVGTSSTQGCLKQLDTMRVDFLPIQGNIIDFQNQYFLFQVFQSR